MRDPRTLLEELIESLEVELAQVRNCWRENSEHFKTVDRGNKAAFTPKPPWKPAQEASGSASFGVSPNKFLNLAHRLFANDGVLVAISTMARIDACFISFLVSCRAWIRL